MKLLGAVQVDGPVTVAHHDGRIHLRFGPLDTVSVSEHTYATLLTAMLTDRAQRMTAEKERPTRISTAGAVAPGDVIHYDDEFVQVAARLNDFDTVWLTFADQRQVEVPKRAVVWIAE